MTHLLRIGAALAAAVFTVTLFGTTGSEASPFCSKNRGSGYLQAGDVYFVGVSTGDTALAGPGQVDFRITGGHFGPAVDRSIYGQVMRVERYGGPTNALSPAEAPWAVVVPWDYDAGCRPTPWTRTARFVPPGSLGFYKSRLRPESDWVDGMPTFDTHAPQFEGYPNDRESGREWTRRERENGLSADELFDVYELVPSRDALAARHWDAAEPLMAWARANPEKGAAYPVPAILRTVAYEADDGWVRTLPMTVTGTYRIDVELPSGTSHHFFLRTAAEPMSATHRPTREPPRDITSGPFATGFDLYFWHAPTLDRLPIDAATAPEESRGIWPMSVATHPDTVAGRLEWVGHLEPPQLGRTIQGVAELDSLLVAHGEYFSERWKAGEVLVDLARFVQDEAGTMRFALRVPTGSGADIAVTGLRVSTESVPGRGR